MKRFIALVLSLVMALSLCAPAYAEGETVITSQDDFEAAIENGETSITLGEGEYTIPAAASGKTLTITGAGADKTTITVVPAGQGEANGQLDYSLDGSTVTFNNLTIKTNSQLYAGYARLSATYNDCVIQNTYNLGTGNSEFNNCVFNITNEYLRVGGAYSAIFDGCTFNTEGRAILVFQDGTSVAQTVTVKDCTFNATAAANTWNGIHVAAVSIDGTNGTYAVSLVGKNVVDEDFNGLWQIKAGEANVTVTEVLPPVAEIGDADYDTLQAAVDAVQDGETIIVNVSGQEAVVNAAKSFAVTGEAVTITAADGFDLAVSEGKYTVTVKKAEVGEVETEVAVVAPEVTVEVDVDNDAEKAVVDALKTENAVSLDNTALTTVAEAIEVVVEEEKVADALANASIPVATGDEVSVVVQSYYDVKVENITVDEAGAATIELDITPMYQVVATTADSAEDIDLDGADKNAVVITEAQPIEKPITEKVTITIAIPEVVAELATDNKLYVTHEAKSGTYVYDATVSNKDGVYTITFVNEHGFSSFTVDAQDNTVAVVDGVKYADLQSAVNNVPSGGTIKVLKSDVEAEIVKAKSFKLELNEGVDNVIIKYGDDLIVNSTANGNVISYVAYEKGSFGWGGYIPTTPADDEDKPIKSADTFDAGIALYAAVSVMGAMGAVVLGKKRED